MWFENHVPGYRFRCGGASQFAASVDTNLGPNRAEPILSQVLPASAASFQSVLNPHRALRQGQPIRQGTAAENNALR